MRSPTYESRRSAAAAMSAAAPEMSPSPPEARDEASSAM